MAHQRSKRSRDLRNVSFGENDSDLVEFLSDKGRFSTYIKQLLREEIERQKIQEVSEEVERNQLQKDVAEILDILKRGNINITTQAETKATSVSEKSKKKRNKFGKMLMESIPYEDED